MHQVPYACPGPEVLVFSKELATQTGRDVCFGNRESRPQLPKHLACASHRNAKTLTCDFLCLDVALALPALVREVVKDVLDI